MLQKHIETTHSNEELSNLNCLNCGFIAINDRQLGDHIDLCYALESQPEFSCDMCDFAAKNKGGLTRHKNSQHQKKMST